MVHGDCSSRGCYAMTNAQIEEIYALATAAFKGGQKHFNVHAFPFRLSDANLARYAGNQWYDFWANLKEGYDHFEATNRLPGVGVKAGKYVFYDDAETPLSAAAFAGDGRVTMIYSPKG
jgi:murein L,D-transpeptidase YafK